MSKLQLNLTGLKELKEKLGAITQEETIKKALSQSTIYLAAWSAKNRIRPLNRNKKDVDPNMLTARSRVGYKTRIFGQPPSEIKKTGRIYIGMFGTNIKARGFSYPQLHELGGRFHRKRPVLGPAVESQDNINQVTLIMNKVIQEALDK